MKNILLQIEDNLYYQLVELKGKLKANTWEELIQKIADQCLNS